MSDDISKDSEGMDEQCRYMDGIIKGSLGLLFFGVCVCVCVCVCVFI